jgi:tetrahydromethanopterin S-methyltransferase subunit G
MNEPTEDQVQEIKKRQEAALQELSKVYAQRIDDDMGKLHNQIVGFISTSNTPLPYVVMVLEMVKQEAIKLAFKKYLEES